MGTTIAGIGVVATLITIVVGGYAIYLQRALSKQSKLEFNKLSLQQIMQRIKIY